MGRKKRLANLKDHGVDFRLAAKIFEGGFYETEDLRETMANNAGEPWAVLMAITTLLLTHGAEDAEG